MKFLRTFLAALLAFVVGFFVVFVVWLSSLAGMLGSMSKTVVVEDQSILKIDFAETMIDAPSTNPFAGIDPMSLSSTGQLPLFKALRAIDAAKEDGRIKGIYLRMNGMGGVSGSAILEELRTALKEFKESGKFVVAYNEMYSQGGYYLASVADKVYMQPQGGLDWSGLSAQVMFYKGLIDKLGMKVEIFRPTACRYKSAVEPYFLKEMSPANREQMQQLVTSSWQTISEAVAESRGVEVEKLNEIADGLKIAMAEDAVKEGLVDKLIYEDEMNDVFADLGVEADKDGEYRFVTLGEYASQVNNLENLTAPEVAIVYADGGIVDGEGTNGKDVFGGSLAATLRKVRLDEEVRAVVLRVNSPGGSALASDVIWREMELLRAEKPVIVSMGSYAASGGYYISAPADAIVADKLTLTGSIGVFGMLPNVGNALEKNLGVTVDGVKTNKEGQISPFEPLSKVQRESILRGVDKVYETFTGLVAKGRNLELDHVLEIAQGRVWSGKEALGIGLVDANGGLKTAIALAVDKAGLGEEYYIREVLEQPEGFAALFSSLNARVKEALIGSELMDVMKDYEKIHQALSQQGIVTYCPYTLEF